MIFNIKMKNILLILTILDFLHFSISQDNLNTPPHVSFDREWILTEEEPVGSTVTRIIVHDVDRDAISISIGTPSSKAFRGREDAASFFVVDEQLRVKLARSVKGLAGETFLVGVIVSDGHLRNRLDAKVTIKKPNEIVKLIPSGLGLPSSFHPGPPPPPLSDLRNSPHGNNHGPPLLHLDPFTIWKVPENASVGTYIAKVEAEDLSRTFLRFSLRPSTLLAIDAASGVVQVVNSLENQVGDHTIEIKVSDKYSFITEEVILRVLPSGSVDTEFVTVDPHLQDSVNDNEIQEETTTINEESSNIPEAIEPTIPKKTGSLTSTALLMVLVFGVLPFLMLGAFLLWKFRRRLKPRSARKESSVSFSPKGVDVIRLGSERRDSVLAGIFSAVGFLKRAPSNRYEENMSSPNIPNRDFKSSTKSTVSSTSTLDIKDEWEFPRHKIRVLDKLGEGCFGQVWKCEAVDLIDFGSTTVAVKTLKESSGAEEHKDLLQELKVLKSLGQHLNVVSLLGCCTDKDPIFIILEYMSGGKLQSYLRSSRISHTYGNLVGASDCLTPKDLTIFARQVANGMLFLSENGIIHRDLAARNILMGENKLCKVADFGFARDVANNHVYERKSDGRLPIRWMAPESLFDNIYTTKADVWSFGILLWEIVTLGSTPYPGMSATDVMRGIKDGYRLEMPDHCRREIYNVMYYCWDSNPHCRPSFAELVKTLESMISSEVDYIQLDKFPEHDYYNFSPNGASGELL